MSKLKELTWEVHQRAERTEFARKLIKGLSPEDYHRYLFNQYMIYSALEERGNDVLKDLSDINRAKYIKQDLAELEQEFGIVPAEHLLTDTVFEYINYVQNLDDAGVIAHVYVRHFGDMYGGQMIKKRNPGSGAMYDFDNVDELKIRVRSMLHDDMAVEANRCFEFAIQLFADLDNE